MSPRTWLLCVGLCLLVSGLSACGDAPEDELHQWMAEQRSQSQPRVKPLAAPTQFKPQNYEAAPGADPFAQQRLTAALKKATAETGQTNDALVKPELARRKDPLEEFPLDAMAYVGSLNQGGQPVALVSVGKLLYQVRPGDHLGQNYGKVLKITDTEISLREIIQDAAGEWTERTAQLQLQERSK